MSTKVNDTDYDEIRRIKAVVVIIFIGLGAGISLFLLLGIFFARNIIKLKEFAAEEERDRIAVEFHDGLAQDLASIIKRLELCEKLFKFDPQRALKELNDLKDNTKEGLIKTRQLIFELKSPREGEFNLLADLANYARNYELENDIKVNLNISGPIDDIPSDKAETIFYIIREALVNVKKHSFANKVEVGLSLNSNNGLQIDIKDNGNGFDIDKVDALTSNYGRWGLMTMRQRASVLKGTLTVDSRPKEGTRISVSIPVLGG